MARPYPWKCPQCRERALSPAVVDYSTEMEHDGRVYPVEIKGLEILQCGKCGARQLPDEAEAKLHAELRRQAGLLTPAQIAAKRKALGLSQKDFALLLGVAPETVNRWENGGQIQQRVMNDFMKAFFDVPELRAYLTRMRSGWSGGSGHGTLIAAGGGRWHDYSMPAGVTSVGNAVLHVLDQRGAALSVGVWQGGDLTLVNTPSRPLDVFSGIPANALVVK